jgi:nitrogen fixation protein FixH
MAGGEPRPLQGWHVLLYVLGFFAPIFAVNGYFLYSALSTHTGIVANEPYRKGLHYNDRIAADATQAELGWHGDVELAPDNGRLKVAISSRDDRTR